MAKSCLVILSHSSYSDIWELTLNSIRKHISCDLDLYITSDDSLNEETKMMVETMGFEILYYPKNISWSEALRYTINNYLHGKYDSTIFSFDDLVLLKNVPKSFLQRSCEYIKDVDYLVLNWGHHNIFSIFEGLFTKKSFFKLSKFDSYLGSLVFTMWNTAFIYKIINLKDFDNLNPWQYEVKISKMMIEFENKGFYIVRRSFLNYANVVIKGKIFTTDLLKAEKINGILYNGSRQKMNFITDMKFYLYKTIFKIMRFILPHYIFQKLRKTY